MPCYIASYETPGCLLYDMLYESWQYDMLCDHDILYDLLWKLQEKLCKSGFISRPCRLTYPQPYPETVWGANCQVFQITCARPRGSLVILNKHLLVSSVLSGLWTGGNSRYQAVAMWCRYILRALSSTSAKVSRANSLSSRIHWRKEGHNRHQGRLRTLGKLRGTWTHMALEAFRVQISWREGPDKKNSGWAQWHCPR